MDSLRRYVLALLMMIFSSQCLAIDPIGWSVAGTFPSPVVVGIGPYTVTYTFRNQLPLTLVKPLVIEKKVTSNEFTFNDQCTGLRLAPRATCTVQINFTATSAGFKQVQLTIAGYDNNRVPLPSLSLTSSATGGIQITGTVTTPLQSSVQVNDSSSFTYTFTNNGAATATGVSIQSSVTNFSTTCTNQLLPQASCQVNGTFTPTSATPATQSATATFIYNQGSPVTVSSSTTVFANTGITGTIPTPLFGGTVVNTAYTVVFQFNNNENSIIPFSESDSFPAEFTVAPGDNTCTAFAGNFPALASCTITGTFNAASTGSYTIGVTIAPTGYPVVNLPTSTTTSAASPSARVINFINQCDFDVNFGLTGANVQPSCAGGCPTGTQCNSNSGCFWSDSGPNNGNYVLTASGGTNSVTLPYNPINNIVWSGAISGRTGCSGTATCVQASCNATGGGNQACDTGVGFNQPATQAEFTLLDTGADTYDIEVINGFHIPIQIAPIGVSSSEYTCGSPGAPTPIDGFGACLWDSVPPLTNQYYWVGGGSGTTCNISSPTCSTPGEICGLNIGINPVCGQFLGYWTGDGACGINKTNAAPYFNCNAPLTSPFPSNPPYTLTDLYQCKTPDASQPLLNSGYLVGANNTSCGCANWQTLPLIPPILLPASTQSCIGSSTQWVSQVQPTLQWIKQACPNAYSYPFDDKSSTFTCQNGAQNTLGYTITFCAGGTGLPTGVTDGRT